MNPGAISSESLDDSLTLHENFERVAARFPESVAVTDGRSQLTYRELDARAGRLARALRAAGAGRDQRVGLCVERGTDLVVGLLGILKAGAGYVPVDPAYPAERRDFVLGSCDAGVVVASTATAALTGGRTAVLVDALPETDADTPEDTPEATPAGHTAADASSLAYVIFTSGSSGEPKGVLVEHRNAVRLFTATAPVFGFDETDVWSNFHSAAFDFSVWEIWGALLHGGRLVVVDNETARDPRAFHALLRRERVTVLNQTPSAFRNLVNADTDAGALSLRYVVFGGEKLDYRALTPWTDRHGLDTPALVNMYGITETTVHVTWKRISAADLAGEGLSPIGEPISDLRVDILDEDGNSLPLGEEGLIHVAGAGVARGYLNHPELTAERFFERTEPDGTTSRWYDSGDRGVQTAPGVFAYAGRADRQLKIRGYRVEPGEIETVLKKHPAVRDAVVLAADFGPGDPRLVAYPVTEAGAASERLAEELKDAVAAALPAYMAPSAYLPIDELPVTVNGKLDESVLRKRLELRLAETAHSAQHQQQRTTSVEETLRGIWAEVLGTDAIADTDEFFDLGGTSFSLIHMLSVVNDRFKLSLNVGTLAEGANIAALAAAVKNQLALVSH
ncbi:amino acid adenylation domain-containing protein [Streptomyces vilmorinianum]|uniref:amino acid adenylation domain-containing protein n=1 Tax=Streptomyces vilmorinianum TaxID=3051092 RepID=UPI0010FBAA95|nr:amino acid adenylation domain-containing protein [Streptomyces vilmorinianum]